MNFENFSYEHLDLVMKYLNKHCKGNKLKIAFDEHKRLIFETTNMLNEQIKIIVFKEEAEYKPRIIKEDVLTI